jgi:hypothetical protein
MAELPTTIRTESNGHLVSGIAIGFVSASAVFVAGRFYTRAFLLGSVGKDDWSMLVATVRSLTPLFGGLLTISSGLLSHQLHSHVL